MIGELVTETPGDRPVTADLARLKKVLADWPEDSRFEVPAAMLRRIVTALERQAKLEAALRDSRQYADHIGRCVGDPNPGRCVCGMFEWEDRVRVLLVEPTVA